MAGTYVARRERLARRLAVRSVAAEAAQTLPFFFPFAFGLFSCPLYADSPSSWGEEGEGGDTPRPAKGLPPLGTLLKIPFAGEEGEGNTPRSPLGTPLKISFRGEESEGNTPRSPLGTPLKIFLRGEEGEGNTPRSPLGTLLKILLRGEEGEGNIPRSP